MQAYDPDATTDRFLIEEMSPTPLTELVGDAVTVLLSATPKPAPVDLVAPVPLLGTLMDHPAFSAFCCLRGDKIVMEAAAADFSTTTPYSIQSVTKLHIHLIVGHLVQQGMKARFTSALAKKVIPRSPAAVASAPVI